MDMKLIKNKDNAISLFNSFLNKHLTLSKKVQVEMGRYGSKSVNENLTIKFTSSDDFLIYAGFLKLNQNLLYFFGFDNKYLRNKKQFKKVTPPISINFNDNPDKSAIVLGEYNDEIFILIKLNFDSLSDNEEAVLRYYNDILEIEKLEYINFGSISEGKSTLKKFRKFIRSATFDKKEHRFLKILSITIPKDIDKILNPSNLENDGFCEICGKEISETYESNPKISEVTGINSSKCLNCFSKILVSYFNSIIGENYTNKSYLMSNVENSEMIKFYLTLSEMLGCIDKNHEIKFKDNFKEYEKYFNEIPDNLKISSIPPGKKGINNIVTKIDELTLDYNILSQEFTQLLSENDLSEEYGWEIRDILIDDAKEGVLKNTKKNIGERILNLISMRSSKITKYNPFKLSKKLNELTLSNESSFNEDFINKLERNGLAVDDGFEIRTQLIKDIEDKIIFTEDQLETKFNELISEKSGALPKKEKFVKKEYCILGNSCFIKAIAPNSELIELFEMLEYIKADEIMFDSIIVLKETKSYNKVFVEFELKNGDLRFEEILADNGFNNKLNGD